MLLVLPRQVGAQAFRIDVMGTTSDIRWNYGQPSPSAGGGATEISTPSSNRGAVAVAFTVRKAMAPWLAATTGVQLVPKGSGATGVALHMTYVELPLLLVLQTSDPDGVFVQGGISVGYRATCSQIQTALSADYGRDCTNMVDPVSSWDVSYALGLGWRSPQVGPGRFVASVLLEESLGDIQLSDRSSRTVNSVATWALGWEWRLD
jgi:Outer membrane protein beta-barrel domain